MLLLAALWGGYTLVLLPPVPAEEEVLLELDVRLLVGNQPEAGIQVDRENLPEYAPSHAVLRESRTPPSPSVQLIARSSGTNGPGKWVAVSSAGLLSILTSHGSLLYPEGARVLSVLPWHHLFGLVIELLPALFAGCEVIRSALNGRKTDELLDLDLEHGITHLSGVPLTFLRLVETPGGKEFIGRLKGGVVGGAAISDFLAKALTGTRLRVGYGQTEASPGIALGDAGVFFPGCLGRPLGCEVRITSEGLLQFKGPNACLGFWVNGALVPEKAEWRNSGDLAEWSAEGLRFTGRADDCFKLANGRMVNPSLIEERLRTLTESKGHFWVFTRDCRTLSLIYEQPLARALAQPLLEAAFGGLAGVCHEIQPQVPGFFLTTPKGDLQRRAMHKRLGQKCFC